MECAKCFDSMFSDKLDHLRHSFEMEPFEWKKEGQYSMNTCWIQMHLILPKKNKV